ncbi:MAG: hypothetical protein Q7T74_00415, partial [Candidatus Saccharibacteria bacterium]|nr:hypothetical protein [Candidatus Saccharibacteria bacterium]
IDSYRNVDGVLVGWPGYSWLFYYGYNLGIFLPSLTALMITLQFKQLSIFWASIRHEWPVLVIGFGMLLIAELLPRFGLAYLPDRAWLFIVLMLSLLIPYAINLLIGKYSWASKMIALIMFGSIAMGSYVTYAKQGWMTNAESAAIPFIQTQTDKSAIFFGQGGSRPAIRYFAERTLVTPPEEIFLSHDKDVVKKYLDDQITNRQLAFEQIRARRLALADSLAQLSLDVKGLRNKSDTIAFKEKADQLIEQMANGQYDESTSVESNIVDNLPIYILYDRTKFNSLYGQRVWWRSSNFYGADTDKFTYSYPLIYNERGVMIWKVR